MDVTRGTMRQVLDALYDCMGQVDVDREGFWAVHPISWQLALTMDGDRFFELETLALAQNLVAHVIEDGWREGYVLTDDGIAFVLRQRQRAKALIPDDLRWQIWERDNFACQHCGSRQFLSVDHVVPESRGGTLEPSNLQTLCRSCNSRKGVRL